MQIVGARQQRNPFLIIAEPKPLLREKTAHFRQSCFLTEKKKLQLETYAGVRRFLSIRGCARPNFFSYVSFF